MYTRELMPKASRPVVAGQFAFGNYAEQFDYVNLLDARHPYLFPFPRFFKRWRIKEWQVLRVLGPTHYLSASLFDAKSFSVAQLELHELGTAEVAVYRRVVPLSRVKLPRDLKDSRSTFRSRALKIGLGLGLGRSDASLEASATDFHGLPDLRASITCEDPPGRMPPLVTCLPLGPNRGSYSYRALQQASGSVEVGGRAIEFPKGKSLAMLCDQKGFYSYRGRLGWVGGMGFDPKGKGFGFSLSEGPSKSPDKVNECALWAGGKLHLLPPVRITMPGGPDKPWFIQDTEGMVDLGFRPAAADALDLDLLAVKLRRVGPVGTLSGFVMAGERGKLEFEGLFGMGECCSFAL